MVHLRKFDGLTRREALACAGGAGLAWVGLGARADAAESPRFGLGFSLYGMKSLPPNDALREVAEIGYDCVELPVMADWPADSRTWTRQARESFRAELAARRLRLSALMENLPLAGPASKVAEWNERLRLALALARELAPDSPPPVETILGGQPSQWEETRQELARRLKTWAELAAEQRVVVAIKPHVAGAMHRPEHAVWLLEQVGSPWIRAAFDYSHYELRGLSIADAVAPLAKRCVFAHVKDSRGDSDKFQFLLPGEGRTDYDRLFEALARAGYSGDVVVEVSGQIHSRPDYDPREAARRSYGPLAESLRRTNLRRPR